MNSRRSYTDADLTAAVAVARSWRGVLRALGLPAGSGSALRSVRCHADRLALDHTHFVGQRRWSDDALESALTTAGSWGQAATALGLTGGSAIGTVKAHALRLGLDTSHFSSDRREIDQSAASLSPDADHLRRAGSMIAAAWFMLCGAEVSWPLEPARYDLVVDVDRRLHRIQVKTTTVHDGRGWTVWLSSTRKERVLYSPDDIDAFFIVTAKLDIYLIPIAAVAGLHAIQLSAYQRFRLERTLAGISPEVP